MRGLLRAGVPVVLVAALVAGPGSPAHATVGASVVGTGTAGSATFDIDAVGGPGDTATGHADFGLAIGSVLTDVTFLCITGNEAVISAVVREGSTAVPAGSGAYVHVRDNGQLPTGTDQLRLELVEFPPPACGTFNLISPAAVTSGDIMVTDVQLQSIAVTPANPVIGKKDRQQFTAVGTYSNATTADLTTAASWTSSDPTVATVDAAGLATAHKKGTTTIRAVVGSVVGSTTLTVSNKSR